MIPMIVHRQIAHQIVHRQIALAIVLAIVLVHRQTVVAAL